MTASALSIPLHRRPYRHGSLPRFGGAFLCMRAPADAGHDIVVKAGLTADQFVWLRDEAEARGLSLSALIRSLIQAERRRQHAAHLGIGAHPADSAGAGPERDE